MNERSAPIRVALAQTAPVLGDLDRNLEGHLSAIHRAADERARLVVFPELSLTGYELRDLVPDVAVRLGKDARFKKLLDASRRVAIAVGFVEETDAHHYYNAAAYLEGGAVVHVHRKVHLPTYGMFDEGRYFAPGADFRAFPTSFGRAGILVCEDFWHPASSYVLALDGARLLLVMAASPVKEMRGGSEGGPSSQSVWTDLAAVCARSYGIATMFANRAGGEDQAVFAGGSFAMAPGGRLLARAREGEEELLVTEISDGEVRRARTRYPILKDERPEIVLRALGRITGLAPASESGTAPASATRSARPKRPKARRRS